MSHSLYDIYVIAVVKGLRGGGGGYQAYFFGNINFEIEVAQQGPYMYQHFGEVAPRSRNFTKMLVHVWTLLGNFYLKIDVPKKICLVPPP